MPKTNTYMLSDDYTHLEARALYQDFNYETTNGCWYHFEFESDALTVKDLKLIQDGEHLFTNDEIHKMQAVFYAFANKLLSAAEMNEIREVIAMTKLGQMILEDGIERGIERGLEKGIQSLIETCKEFNLSKQETMSRIIDKFSLPEEKAQSSIEKYWK